MTRRNKDNEPFWKKNLLTLWILSLSLGVGLLIWAGIWISENPDTSGILVSTPDDCSRDLVCSAQGDIGCCNYYNEQSGRCHRGYIANNQCIIDGGDLKSGQIALLVVGGIFVIVPLSPFLLAFAGARY